jgi:hypothetical protein
VGLFFPKHKQLVALSRYDKFAISAPGGAQSPLIGSQSSSPLPVGNFNIIIV